MSVTITIRSVPEQVRDELAQRAARSGRSLQEYLAVQLTEMASQPAVEDVVTRARARAGDGPYVLPGDDRGRPRRRPAVTEPAGRTAVLDSSALVALLTDGGPIGDWVAEAVTGVTPAAPHLAVFEAANIMRRQQLRGDIDATAATLGHQDLIALPLQLWPYSSLAHHAWQLRENVTVYDAAYVALAEFLHAPLLTLNHRLERANGPRCTVRTPPSAG